VVLRVGQFYGVRGTVTQLAKRKVRVLVPIRKFVWIERRFLRVVGFDGDGSKVGWR
jgi:hypothetical protein